jgi:hypothetical protein
LRQSPLRERGIRRSLGPSTIALAKDAKEMISRRLRHGISFQDYCYLIGAERGAAEGLLRGLIDGIVGSWANGMKLGKAKRGGYSKFRYLQFNDFAIVTLFRA